MPLHRNVEPPRPACRGRTTVLTLALRRTGFLRDSFLDSLGPTVGMTSSAISADLVIPAR